MRTRKKKEQKRNKRRELFPSLQANLASRSASVVVRPSRLCFASSLLFGSNESFSAAPRTFRPGTDSRAIRQTSWDISLISVVGSLTVVSCLVVSPLAPALWHGCPPFPAGSSGGVFIRTFCSSKVEIKRFKQYDCW